MLPEITQYLERIEDIRSQVIKVIQDLSPEALNWRPIEVEDDHVTNSLAVMAAHVAGAEHFWIAEVIAKQPATRDRDSEFNVHTDNSAELVESLDNVGKETREILSKLTEADLMGDRQVRDKTVPVRWGILHVIDHSSLHLGHMQLTFQLWNHGKTDPSPRWYQRIKDQD